MVFPFSFRRAFSKRIILSVQLTRRRIPEIEHGRYPSGASGEPKRLGFKAGEATQIVVCSQGKATLLPPQQVRPWEISPPEDLSTSWGALSQAEAKRKNQADRERKT